MPNAARLIAIRSHGAHSQRTLSLTWFHKRSVGVDNENLPVQITKMGCADPSGIVYVTAVLTAC